VRPVVGGVRDDCVIGDAKGVQLVQQRPYHRVVVDHGVVVGGLPPPRLADACRLGMGAQVHVGGVEPHEERSGGSVLALDEIQAVREDVVVDGLPVFGGRRHFWTRMQTAHVTSAKQFPASAF
jgi:hypothetical protein